MTFLAYFVDVIGLAEDEGDDEDETTGLICSIPAAAFLTVRIRSAIPVFLGVTGAVKGLIDSSSLVFVASSMAM